MFVRSLVPAALAGVVLLSSNLAFAAAPSASTEGKPSASKDRGEIRWIERWAPERHTFDLGIVAGLFFPSTIHELYEVDENRFDLGFKRLDRVTAEVGGRLGYYPLRFLGIELEGAIMPTTTPGALSESGTQADLETIVWRVGGHVLGQLPWHSIAPFVTLGASAMGVSSDREALGSDIDPSFDYGVGFKIFVNRHASVRFDLRDSLAAGRNDVLSHNVHALVGLTFTLGRHPADPVSPPAGDEDGDGVTDDVDLCPGRQGVADYQGCPVPDSDNDSVLDLDDECPTEPGMVDYHGCPMIDSDNDGILDREDRCADVPGTTEHQGCPPPDEDGDGIIGSADQCPEASETVNGFEDTDGCPDELPKEVSTFTGVIAGISFSSGTSEIRSTSKPKLDKAVEILTEYPALRMEISGHTDNRGSDAVNLKLSAERAEAVRAYMIEKGVAGGRLQSRGAGAAEPIASNDTSKGRAENRRIEFKLVTD